MTNDPTFDYSKLRGKIVEMFGGQGAFANALCISEGTLSSRLTGKSYFTADEIVRACKLLDIALEEVTDYFFTAKV